MWIFLLVLLWSPAFSVWCGASHPGTRVASRSTGAMQTSPQKARARGHLKYEQELQALALVALGGGEMRFEMYGVRRLLT